METKKIKTLARINNIAVQLVENEAGKFIPIKPICDALGIDSEAQRQRMERDKILSSIMVIIKAVAADEKEREMVCIPLKFTFGWLITIDTSRVNEDAREKVIEYQLECYNILYHYFMSTSEFVVQKQIEIDKQLEIVETAKSNFNTAKNKLSDAEGKLKKLRNLTIDDFDMERRQLKISFD